MKGFHCIRHDAVADACRKQPGTWIHVGTYSTKTSAQATARRIGEGAVYKAYRPAGTFEGRSEMSDLGYTVYARYTRGKP